MATAKKKAETHVRQKQFKGSVGYSLRESDKKAIQELRDKMDVMDTVQTFLDQDFKVSFRWEHDEKCYRCDIYRAYTRYADSGYMYTSYHADPRTCLAICYYVFNEVFDWTMPAGENKDMTW